MTNPISPRAKADAAKAAHDSAVTLLADRRAALPDLRSRAAREAAEAHKAGKPIPKRPAYLNDIEQEIEATESMVALLESEATAAMEAAARAECGAIVAELETKHAAPHRRSVQMALACMAAATAAYIRATGEHPNWQDFLNRFKDHFIPSGRPLWHDALEAAHRRAARVNPSHRIDDAMFLDVPPVTAEHLAMAKSHLSTLDG